MRQQGAASFAGDRSGCCFAQLNCCVSSMHCNAMLQGAPWQLRLRLLQIQRAAAVLRAG
jgi:hypothetical protein